MRWRCHVAPGILLACVAVAVAVATPVGATTPGDGGVSFGAAVLAPVVGAPFPAANLTGLAAAGDGWTLTLTRTADASSPRLRRAQVRGEHFKTIALAWSTTGRVQSACLGDAAITSLATRPVTGGPPVEHATIFFAALTRAVGTGACARQAAPRPVVVRLFTDRSGTLHARLDCMLAHCAGSLRLFCAGLGCPASGLRVGAFNLGPGQERILRVPLVARLRGRHPKLTTSITLTGRRAAILAQVVVDAPAPPRLPTLTTTVPSSSPSPLPAGATPGGPGSSAPGGGPSSGGGSGTSGAGAGPGSGSGSGGSGSDTGTDTSLSLYCDGAPGGRSAVHGVLDPKLAGQTLEIDYVPVNASADTVIHQVKTTTGGRYSDSAGTPFILAVAFFPGNDTYDGTDQICE